MSCLSKTLLKQDVDGVGGFEDAPRIVVGCKPGQHCLALCQLAAAMGDDVVAVHHYRQQMAAGGYQMVSALYVYYHPRQNDAVRLSCARQLFFNGLGA